MNLSTIKRFVTSSVSRQVLKTQKASPTILLGVSVVGVAATAVLAGKATLDLEHVMDIHEERMAKRAVLVREDRPEYTEAQAKSDFALIHVKTAGNLLRLYGPTLAVGGVTIASMIGSHRILNGRNAALAAAYATLDTAYREYRQRVRDEYGEEVDEKFYLGRSDIPVVDEKDKPTGEVEKIQTAGSNPYTFLFHEFNDNWNEAKPEYNFLFLRQQQNWQNDRLRARGHLFLNEVLDDLGLERTKAGAVVGWIWNGDGDNVVDFGLFSEASQDHALYNMVTGAEKGLWLNFNVDGVIHDKI